MSTDNKNNKHHKKNICFVIPTWATGKGTGGAELQCYYLSEELIKIEQQNLVEMAGADKCCGMGGSFNIYHYDLSSSIGKLKQQNISDTATSMSDATVQ